MVERALECTQNITEMCVHLAAGYGGDRRHLVLVSGVSGILVHIAEWPSKHGETCVTLELTFHHDITAEPNDTAASHTQSHTNS